jgi:hypothetical protein
MEPGGPFGSTAASLSGVNASGEFVGRYQAAGGADYGYLWNGSSYVALIPPGAASSEALAFLSTGILGDFHDAAGNEHYFLWDGTNYDTFDLPSDGRYAIDGADSDTVVGYYIGGDSVFHGFEATISVPEPGTLALLAAGGALALLRRGRERG